MLTPALQCRDNRIRAALTVQKLVVIAVWKLATPSASGQWLFQLQNDFTKWDLSSCKCKRPFNHLLLLRTVTLYNVQDRVDRFAAMGLWTIPSVFLTA